MPALVRGDSAYLLADVLAAGDGAPAASGQTIVQIIATADDTLFVRWDEALDAHITMGDARPHSLESLGPPVSPGKVICVGRNYAAHARELGNDLPERPILFAKFANAIRGPFDDIVRPREVDDLDYEAELGVVIGRRGRRIPRHKAFDYVAGYCCANDVSARTAQLGMGDQWLRGKSYDSFCPIGPVIVTRDEVADPQNLRVVCRVDGEVRQEGNTEDMIFDVATLISYCSDAFTLEPGDLILTGTPAGVAMGRDPAPWLQPGQLCEVEIEAVGRIANRIVQEGTTS